MDLKLKNNSKLKIQTFTRLEYIKSNGTQYIDTGVLQNTIKKYELVWMGDETSVPTLGGKSGGWGFKDSLISYLYAGNAIYYSSGNGNFVRMNGTTGVKYTEIYNNGTLSVNGQTGNIGTLQKNINLTIFYGGGKYGNGKIYSMKIYDQSMNLIRDFLPVKDSSGVVCLYDNVSKKYFYNQGTGDFVAGPTVENNYQIPNTVVASITSIFHQNTLNVSGFDFIKKVLNYQKTHQDEVKEYYYPTTQVWKGIVAQYPEIVPYYNQNHKLCVCICEADDPEQCAEDFLQAIEDYPSLASVIAKYPSLASVIVENNEVVHSLVDTGYETFLTSSGTQYIDTGFKPTNDSGMYLKFKITQVRKPDTSQNPIGSQISWQNTMFRLVYDTTAGWRYGYGDGYADFNNTDRIALLEFEANKNNAILNGIAITSASYTFTSNNSIYLYTVNSNGTPVTDGGVSLCCRIYCCKLYNNDTLTQWLVPIQNNGNPCMIDLLTGTKYINQGTGSFTYSLEQKNA